MMDDGNIGAGAVGTAPSLKRQGPTTKAAAAADAIRDAIQQGMLKPGDRLLLPHLAAQLQMSYTPLREGLRQLQSEGFVEHRPHIGAVVARFDLRRAAEIYRLREVLEPLATELAATNVSDTQLQEVEESLARLDSAIEAERASEIPALNAAFHRAIYEAGGSTILVEFIDRLWNGVPYQAISLVDRARESSHEHAEILSALRRKDPERARMLMQAHISKGARAAEAALIDEQGRAP